MSANGRRYPTFPWFGKKTRIAKQVWEKLGRVERYIEPFGGSLSVLLENPHWETTFEIANDLDGFVVNYFRAVRSDPEALWEYAAVPPHEVDLHARHAWLQEVGRKRMYNLVLDPEYYDVQTAAYWYFGISIWIGGQWCLRTDWRKPSSTDSRMTVEIRKGKEVLLKSLRAFSDRLRCVRILCGDWKRCVTSAMMMSAKTGVFLDPPYFEDCASCSKRVYQHAEKSLQKEVVDFARSMKENEKVKIIVCGQGGEYDQLMSDGWSKHQWSRARGYSGHGGNDTGGKSRRKEDSYWCSPNCIVEKAYKVRALF